MLSLYSKSNDTLLVFKLVINFMRSLTLALLKIHIISNELNACKNVIDPYLHCNISCNCVIII